MCRSPGNGLYFEVGLGLHRDLNSLFGVDVGTRSDGVGEGGGDGDVIFHKEGVREGISIVLLIL